MKEFSGETKDGETLNKRDGSDNDVKKLKKLWEQLSFTVKCPREGKKKAHDIRGFVTDAEKEIDKNSSCFVCCIMSHGGDMGEIYGEDSKQIDIKSIIDLFKGCQALTGKPKLFFIQTCRGNKTLEDHCYAKLKSSISMPVTPSTSTAVPRAIDCHSQTMKDSISVKVNDTDDNGNNGSSAIAPYDILLGYSTVEGKKFFLLAHEHWVVFDAMRTRAF